MFLYSALLYSPFFLGYLIAIISACSSEISTPAPTLEPEKPPPATVTEKTPEVSSVTDSSEKGKSFFISKACVGCHTIQGMPEAQGKVGPELTHQASNSLILGILPNTEENLKEYLKDPAKVKPGSLMPNQYLTDSEIEALVAFLLTLK